MLKAHGVVEPPPQAEDHQVERHQGRGMLHHQNEATAPAPSGRVLLRQHHGPFIIGTSTWRGKIFAAMRAHRQRRAPRWSGLLAGSARDCCDGAVDILCSGPVGTPDPHGRPSSVRPGSRFCPLHGFTTARVRASWFPPGSRKVHEHLVQDYLVEHLDPRLWARASWRAGRSGSDRRDP